MTRRPLPYAAVALSAALALAGCETMSARESGTAKGAAAGALAGAVLASTTGGKAGTGAVAGAAVGAIAGNLWSKRMEDKRRAMERAAQGTGIGVDKTANNELKVNVPSDVSFATGSSALNPSLRPILDQFAQGLDNTTLVRIVGHTDSTGSDTVNDPLSLQRARTVSNYLQDRGVPAGRLEIAGRGSREPVADNGSVDGRSQNRRVEIFLREPSA